MRFRVLIQPTTYSMISLIIVAIIASTSKAESAVDDPTTYKTCTSADEFAAPTDGHCKPLIECPVLLSGSNTARFRLILRALLCDDVGVSSPLENPNVCCPDPRVNLIKSQPSEFEYENADDTGDLAGGGSQESNPSAETTATPASTTDYLVSDEAIKIIPAESQSQTMGDESAFNITSESNTTVDTLFSENITDATEYISTTASDETDY